ncbi:DUF7350 domain-containing protein [Haloglomus litoreum]|uniref:DUF7350 domain-containing protein n=1 Tax=Haloglomus litoreum TaxID=3034026 RepID=UPI0023E7974E|nr:hypothetical protein [Haloglomus sp. DT116]
MQRRDFLLGAAGAGATGLAGCSGLVETRSLSSPPVLSNRPDAVYFPTHVEGMEMSGMGKSGDYQFALMYSYPHRFWNVNGDEVQKTSIEDDDDVHLMASVWDPETGIVLPETGLSIEISKGGDLVSQEVIYPMLSQPMGFHYGANFSLDGDGSYDVTLSVGGMNIRRTGAFEGRFGDPAETTIGFDYSQAARDEIMFEETPDKAGQRMARSPMEMGMLPQSTLPPAEELPGTVRGTAETGDAKLVVTTLESPPAGVDAPDGSQYLAVSARTPYNRMVLPAMALEGTLTSGGETVFDGTLSRTLDPDLNYHYGAAVGSVASGDTLELRVTTPPQVARHEGYETAFVDMQPTSLTL